MIGPRKGITAPQTPAAEVARDRRRSGALAAVLDAGGSALVGWGAFVKRTVTLEIAGARYRMASDADEEHLRRLADLVNERIAALGPKATKSATPAQLLAVVALGLADELVQSEGRRRELEASTREALGRAIARIDKRLEADGTREQDG